MFIGLPAAGSAGWGGWEAAAPVAGRSEYGGKPVGGQMAFKCGIDQGAGRRTVEGCVPMKLNGNAGNTGLAANAQIQHLQDVIELAQVVVDQMNRKVGRLFYRIHAQ